MGYMTTVTFLNDGFSNIENDPQGFVEKIKEGMNGINRYNMKERKNVNTYGLGSHANMIQVVKSHHADDSRMFVASQNSLDIIGWGNDSTHLEHRKRILEIAKQMIKREAEEIKRLEEELKSELKDNFKGI